MSMVSTPPSLSQIERQFKDSCLTHSQPLSYYHYVIHQAQNHHFDSQNQAQKFMMYHLADEINQIRKGESVYDRLSIVANERDSLIRELRAEMIQGRHSKLLNLSTACQKLENIRVYTLMGLEKIASIRQNSGIQRSQFYLQMIDRLTQGLQFLKFSSLRKHIEFSSQNDPLLMEPSHKFWNMTTGSDFQRRPVIDLFTLDSQLRHRLQTAERFMETIKKQQRQEEEYEDAQVQQKLPSKRGASDHKNMFPQMVRFRNSGPQEQGQVRKQLVSNLIRQAVNQFGEKRFAGPKKRVKTISRSGEVQQRSYSRKISHKHSEYVGYHELGHTENNRTHKQNRLPGIDHRSYVAAAEPVKRQRYKTESVGSAYLTPLKPKPGRIKHVEPMISVDRLSKQQRRQLLKQLNERPSAAQSRQSKSSSHKSLDKRAHLHRLQSIKTKDPKSFGSVSQAKKGKECKIINQYSYQQGGSSNGSIVQGISQIVHDGKGNSLQNSRHNPSSYAPVNRMSHSVQGSSSVVVHPLAQSVVTNDQTVPVKSNLAHETGQYDSRPSQTRIISSAQHSTLKPESKTQSAIQKIESRSLQPEPQAKTSINHPNQLQPIQETRSGQINERVQNSKHTLNLQPPIEGNLPSVRMQSESSKQSLINQINNIPLQSTIPPEPENKPQASFFKKQDEKINQVTPHQQATSIQQTGGVPSNKVSSPAQIEIGAHTIKSGPSDVRTTNQASLNTLQRGDDAKVQQKSSNLSAPSEQPVPVQAVKFQSAEPETKQDPNFKKSSVPVYETSKRGTQSAKLLQESANLKLAVQTPPKSSSISNQNEFPQKSPDIKTSVVMPPTPQLEYSQAPSTPYPSNRQDVTEGRYEQLQPTSSSKPYKLSKNEGMPSIIMEAQHEQSVSMLSITKGEANSPNKKEFTINPIPTTPELEAQNQPEEVTNYALPLKNTPSKDVQKEDIRVNLTQSFVQSLAPNSAKKSTNRAEQISQPQVRAPSPQPSPKNQVIINLPQKRPGTAAYPNNQPNSVTQSLKQKSPSSLSNSMALNIPKHDSNPIRPPPSRNGDPFQTQMSSVRGSEQRFEFGKEQNVTSLLRKCVFQSKAMSEDDLLKQLQTSSPQNFELLQEYITKTFFGRRHLVLINCIVDQQIVGYCLYFPQIVPTGRNVFLLLIDILDKKSESVETSLLSTFFNFIFKNDPCQQIIYLKHTTLLSPKTEECLKKTQFFDGFITTPLKSPLMKEESLKFIRKNVGCKNDQTFTYVMSSVIVMAAPNQQPALKTPAKGKVQLEQGFLEKKMKAFKSEQVMSFANQTLMNAYLSAQSLPFFKLAKFSKQSFLLSQIHEQCLTRARFFAYSKFINFTVEPPKTNLCETENAFFFLLASSTANRYYIMADKLYEEEELDLREELLKNIEGKSVRMFQKESVRSKVVACPYFKKQAEFLLGGGVGTMLIEMNWQDYIKGVRFLKEENVDYWLMNPFLFGEIEADSEGVLHLLYTLEITQKDAIE